MSRTLKIAKDGSIYEFQEEQIIQVTETQGQIQLLIQTLQFTSAETFEVIPDEDIGSRGAVEPRSATRKINEEGIKLIKSFEGLHDLKQNSNGTYVEAYLDPVDIWTIGWGFTEGVYEGMTMTIPEAEARLKKELGKYEISVLDGVKVDINDNQFSALVSFCYNVGARALFESTLLKLLNQGKYKEAADQFLRWDKAGGQVLAGLSRRRRAERSLFLSESWEIKRVLRLSEPGQPLMQGQDVEQLQKALVNAGFNLQPDGIFGGQTEKALKQFQQQNNLTVDGIAGAETLKKLGL
ncbi:glycoside hydrolase family protein [Planktothrix agardhii]|uniref:glycoside hydrolase family protein n=1 Tax=Planktothrix agardhii TaxID=1160 RepID=UPI00040485D6|nr:glycoside hydrolase family protein [Planktothrix agardhii]CAD0229672.1 Lysozyme [Planktothrix agardhii]CAD5981832.1 Endolysin [Planktothrix agardhii]